MKPKSFVDEINQRRDNPMQNLHHVTSTSRPSVDDEDAMIRDALSKRIKYTEAADYDDPDSEWGEGIFTFNKPKKRMSKRQMKAYMAYVRSFRRKKRK